MKNKTLVILMMVMTISLIISLWFFLHFPSPYIAILTDPVGTNCKPVFHEGDFSEYPILEKAVHEEINHPNIDAIYDISILESQNYGQFLEEQFDLEPTSDGIMGNTLCFNYVDKNGTSHRLAVEMGDKTGAADLMG